MIGDGMGQNHIDMAKNNGLEAFVAESLQSFSWCTTYSTSVSLGKASYTDSAASGTALATGHKTLNNYVGVDENGNILTNVREMAYASGAKTAILTTDVITGATPASFSAHADGRYSTAEIIMSQAQARDNYGTVIDCGYDYYDTRYMAVIERHITETLTALSANEKGFFLMYEEAHIDKHSHNNELNKVFKAVVRFNQAIGRFMEFAFYNPDTFILITADHETGDLQYDDNGVLEFNTTEHTNQNVPIFAYGMGAELFDGVEIENIQISHTIAALMGYDNHGDQSVYQSLTKGK
jgi:alkaline phosphatase